MNDDNKGKLDELTLNAWVKQEKIAMHFNDLIIKVRTQALGALAAIITVGGALIHDRGSSTAFPWGLVTAFFGILTAFWVAIWILDFLYYNRLLIGAVDSLLTLEKQIEDRQPIDIKMSHKIEAAVRGGIPPALGTTKGPWFFYSIVFVVLVAGLFGSGYMALYAH